MTGQLLAAYTLLEKHLPQPGGERPSQAALTAAVTWSFTQLKLPSMLKAETFPKLQRLASQLEQHPAFKRYALE